MMSLWYVYDSAGQHVGPVTTDLLARGIAAGKVSREAHVGAVGTASWHPVLQVPEVMHALQRAESAPPPPPQADTTMMMPSLVPVVAEPAAPPAVASPAPAEAPAAAAEGAAAAAVIPPPFPLLPVGIFGASVLVSLLLFGASLVLHR